MSTAFNDRQAAKELVYYRDILKKTTACAILQLRQNNSQHVSKAQCEHLWVHFWSVYPHIVVLEYVFGFDLSRPVAVWNNHTIHGSKVTRVTHKLILLRAMCELWADLSCVDLITDRTSTVWKSLKGTGHLWKLSKTSNLTWGIPTICIK